MTAWVAEPERPVALDAYTGTEPVTGHLAGDLRPWALRESTYGRRTMRPTAVDAAVWDHPRTGWGVILAEPPGATAADAARLDDASPAVRRLVEARSGKVLRYRPGRRYSDWTLRDTSAGGGDLLASSSPVGMGPKELPLYLLIVGGPDEVPWLVQQMLNPVRHVGRLDLDDAGMERYVDALLDDWGGSKARYGSPVLWAVDHGGDDITTLMRTAVAAPLHQAMDGDDEMTPVYVDGSVTAATREALVARLGENQPAVVVTSSHGLTGPLDDVPAMRATLGNPVDQGFQGLDPHELLASWEPDGAIWFSQACCSAGADSPSAYDGLFAQTDGLLDQTLRGVAEAGPMTSPLPRALLSAEKPLRAFIGHVEPTFDWTLSFPPNRQRLTADLIQCLYTHLTLGQPVGLALNPYFRPIGSLLTGYLAALKKYRVTLGGEATKHLDMLVYSRVTAHDRASTVILGDPTVAVRLP